MNCRIKTILIFILIFSTLQGISGNEPPEFLSQPLTTASEFMLYSYTVIVSDPDPDDTLVVFMGSECDWLTLTDYGNDTAVLAGFPAYYFSEEPIALGVSDGKDTSWQNFEISLYCINSGPQIISEPVLTCFVDSTYSYQVMGLDFDGTIQFSAIEKPDWLLLSQTNDDSALLTGIPAISDTGIHKVSIKASRANGICEASSYQNFEIEVKENSFSQEYIPINFLEGIWIETYFEKGGYEEKIQKFCNGDTIVEGMLFHKLFESKVVFPVYYPDTIENIFLGLIGNSDDRTVLFIPKGKDTATVIYDFNINQGDTIRGALHSFVVHEIDSIEICGRMHKRYCQEGVDYLRATLVEGVGFSNGLLGFFDVFEGGETYKTLECYFEKSNPDCSDCNYIIGYSTKELRLVIYPNPVDNLFNIEAPIPITSIRIYNLMGSEVFFKKVDSYKSAVLKITYLTPGQYIIRIRLNDSSVVSSTFIKN